MKQYTKMKDPNISWIGHIPDHWKIMRMRFLGKIETSGVNKKIKKDEELIKLVNYLDIYKNEKKIIDKQTEFTITSCTKQQSRKFNLNEGDVLFTPSSETVDEIGFSAVVDEKLPNVVFSYHLIRFVFNKHFDKFFKKYMFNNYYVLNHFSKNARGTTRQTLKIIDFQNTKVLIPTLNEQEKISQFLEHKMGIMNNLISNVEKQINLLEEKKQSLVNHFVIQGLDNTSDSKNPHMKWVENIPKHWTVSSFKFVLVQKMDNGVFKKKNQFGDGVKLVNVADLYHNNGIIDQKSLERVMVTDEELNKYAVYSNEIFFVRSSLKLDGIGQSSIVKDMEEPLVFECHIIRTKPNTQKMYPDYLRYLLNSHLIRSHLVSVSQTVTMTTISQDHIKNIKIICPPIEEQKTISDYIHKQTENIDDLILKLKSQLKKLQESKQSLIVSAVTGKIDVRGTVA